MTEPTVITVAGVYKGESLVIDVLLQDGAGNPVPSPGDYTVSIVFSATAAGDPIGSAKHDFTLIDVPTATFRKSFAASDLADFQEGKPYCLNIWSRVDGADPVLRALGTMTLQASIELP